MPATDSFSNERDLLSVPASEGIEITPNDSGELDKVTRGIYVGTTGNIRAMLASGGVITFTNVPVGWHPLRVRQILSTGTTASGIVGVW